MAHHGDQELPSAGPRIPPRRLSEVNIEYRAASRRRTARIIGSAILALAVGLVVLAAVGRDAVLAMWPESASIYRAFNLTPSPQAGLKVRLTVTRTNSGVVVAGDIVNSADSEREVPQLRVSLQDTRRNDVDIKTIDPPVARLAAGATARFETVFEHPSMLATGAAAIFAPDR